MRPYSQLRQYRNDLSAHEYWSSTMPVASTDKGPFNVSDLIWNDTPIIGGPIGWICTTAGADASLAVFSPFGAIGPAAAYSAAVNTTGFTATGAQISGGSASVDLALTGTLGAGAAITLPTVANLLAALPGAYVGQTYRLRIINESSANFAWTVTTNTGWTLNGTMTIAQNTWREFIVAITSVASATASLTSVAVGTYS